MSSRAPACSTGACRPASRSRCRRTILRCGKTTLLRLAAGVERPLAGRILINGVEVAGDARFEPPERRGVGLMFQDFALFPHLSNLANVMFGLKSLPKVAAEGAARAALDR